eukprot:gene19279-13594_t
MRGVLWQYAEDGVGIVSDALSAFDFAGLRWRRVPPEGAWPPPLSMPPATLRCDAERGRLVLEYDVLPVAARATATV